jgi:broad specificity phosphatase PhoE
MRPPTIYLIRHGERWDYTDIEWAKNSIYPHDSPLSKVGEDQAKDTGERLSYTKPHLIISSPFQRSVMHAEAVAKKTRVKIGIEPGIAEFMCKETRTKVPDFFLGVTSITPWISTKYQPYCPYLSLETWPELIDRTEQTLRHLIRECYGKGDLLIFSHRSTLQSLISYLVPDFKGDTKLEYGAIAMIVEDPRIPGKWNVCSFNEVKHIETLKKSPSSNPFRHIEGYYEDLNWNKYKSTSGGIETHVSGPSENK